MIPAGSTSDEGRGFTVETRKALAICDDCLTAVHVGQPAKVGGMRVVHERCTHPAEIVPADGLGRTEPYSEPSLSVEHDEDGEPIPETLSAGWDVSFGCRVNFGPSPDGDLRVSVHVSDRARRAGLALSPTTPEQLRALASHLVAVADRAESSR